MNFLVWFLIFSMVSGAFELITVAASGFVKHKRGRNGGRGEISSEPRTPSCFVSGSEVGAAPDAGAPED